MGILNHRQWLALDRRQFTDNRPWSWLSCTRFLTDDAFARLHAEFPPLSLFERHVGIAREYRQRPHNRYYLALEQSLYGRRRGEAGCVTLAELSPTWQAFLRELQTDEVYLGWIRELLGMTTMEVRFAWHVATVGDDVSPHVDGPKKAGTQIFYFNTSADWKPEWGGSTLLLSGRQTAGDAPESVDFTERVAMPMLDNRSLLFRNAPEAWHGVETLRCPPGVYRRIFNVIFEHPDGRAVAMPSWLFRLRRRLARWVVS